MKYVNTIINSFFRTFGRFLFYLLIGILCYFCINCFPKVHAKVQYGLLTITRADVLTGNRNEPANYSDYGNWSRYQSSYSLVVGTPFEFDFQFDNLPSDFNYLYFTGYANFQVVGSGNSACEYIGSSSPSPDNTEQNSSLFAFTFRCHYDGNSIINPHLMGNILFESDSGIQFTPVVFLTDEVWFTDTSNENAIQDTLKQQLQTQQKQVEQQEQTNKELGDLNDNLTSSDTSGANDKASSFFDDFDNKDYGLSDIITLPLDMIKSITSTSCRPLSIPIPFVDTDLTLPCMSTVYQTYFGDILNIYQTITTGLIAYYICINILALVRSFKDPEKDNVEVMEL